MGLKILFFGAGFLFSHTVPSIANILEVAVIVDRERLEPENYENAFYPRRFAGKTKAAVALSLLSQFSGATVVVEARNIQTAEALQEVADRHGVDLVYVTVDNVASRRLALALKQPVLYAGVTERFGYVQWRGHAPLPESDDEIADVVRRVRDACSRAELRPLGAVVGSLAGASIHAFAASGKRVGYYVYEVNGRLVIYSVEVNR